MAGYLLQRLLATIPVLGLIAIITFGILHLTPGDPATVLLGDAATSEETSELRKKMGLDRPIYVQFGKWFAQVVQGDLGKSAFSGQPVLRAIADRLEPTLALSIFSMVMSLLVAIPLGVLAAWRANTWVDRSSMILSVLGFSIPAFWLGINLIFLLGVRVRLLPVMGYSPLAEGLIPCLQHLILPSVTLGLVNAALIARMTRASLLEILQEDYIRTARAKGLSEPRITVHHALRNALIPVVTVIGPLFAALMTGSMVVEQIFAIPGMGKFFVWSVLNRNYPVIMGTVLLYAVFLIIANLVVDIMYAWLDPRIRYT